MSGLAKTLVGCGCSRQWTDDLVATDVSEEGAKEEFGGRVGAWRTSLLMK